MKILLISASNINIIGGDTIQLASEMNMWSLENEVYYFSFTKLHNSTIIGEVSESVNLIFPTKSNGINTPKLTTNEYINETIKLIEKENIDLVVTRGSELVATFNKMYPDVFAQKCLSYVTDYENLNSNEFKSILQNSKYNKCQSEAYANKFVELYNIPREKFIVQNPLIENMRQNIEKTYDIIYAGKIAPGWGIEDFIKILEANPNLKGVLVYSRIFKYAQKDKKNIEEALKNLPNLEIHQGLSREETINLVNKSRIGYGYRTSDIDNENSTEISTKLLEYLNADCVPFVRYCKLHDEIIPNFSQYMVKNDDEVLETFKKISNEKFEENKFYNMSTKFLAVETYKRIKEQMKI